MLFSNGPRRHYRRAPVHEVICQLRFPPILSINHDEPAQFQELVREEFPQYGCKQDLLPPQSAAGRETPQPPVNNHHFLSRDGKWKINLTRDFIALSTLSYTGWEQFARTLDKPLAAFIRLYRPDDFQRVGLRYLNLISPRALGLEGRPWRDLIAPAYLGPLGEEDVEPQRVISCGTDVQLKLSSSCGVKIHAGTGQLKSAAPDTPPDSEVKFIFDMDLSMPGPTAGALAAAALETLHGHGTMVFEGALTDTLRAAMDPGDPVA